MAPREIKKAYRPSPQQAYWLKKLAVRKMFIDQIHQSRLSECVARGWVTTHGKHAVITQFGRDAIGADRKNVRHPCPVCGYQTVARNSIYGPFRGCANYPDCRGTISLPGNPPQWARP